MHVDWTHDSAKVHNVNHVVAVQVDDDAAQDIRALLQGVRDEIESLHATYLKARCTWGEHGVTGSHQR